MSPARDRGSRSRDSDPRGPMMARQGCLDELWVPRTSPERSCGSDYAYTVKLVAELPGNHGQEEYPVPACQSQEGGRLPRAAVPA